MSIAESLQSTIENLMIELFSCRELFPNIIEELIDLLYSPSHVFADMMLTLLEAPTEIQDRFLSVILVD